MAPTASAGTPLRPVREGDASMAQFADLAGQPLLHWSTAQLEGLAMQLGSLLHGWAASWGLDGIDASHASHTSATSADAAGQPSDPPGAALAGQAWLALHADGARTRAWIAAPGAARSAAEQASSLVQLALFGARPAAASMHDEPAVAEVIGRAAWDDFQAVLRRGLRLETPASAGVPASSPDGDDRRLWSGAVLLTLPLAQAGQAPWQLLINGACATQLCTAAPARAAPPPAARPVPLLRALREQALPLRAELSGPELTLGSLRALAVGDVLLLPHALDQPLTLSGAGGQPVCRGFLGQQHGQRALALLANPATDKPAARGRTD
ncbi:Type III flagellar switch regulator (C-ring) FliN C-term [Duganella sacchari]|uniref:Type III flagellar switch regulator (C-ring) FliN C-term n=2 Tax=Duganella sacchari TaxID=551987 RepID=A0A1M7PLL2_9BURK|nr:Type III flagellar switch regulator (C-ring) FliN C-term [Duganella sacchari]